MVDDQQETYGVAWLQNLKQQHEAWVSSTLSEEKKQFPVRLRRIEKNIPRILLRLTSGQDVFKVIGDALAHSFDHDELASEAEVELVSGFLQELQDCGDMWSDWEAGERVRAAHRVNSLVRELEQAGFWIFGNREVQSLEGGLGGASPFPVAIIQVARATNSEIIRVDPLSGDEEH